MSQEDPTIILQQAVASLLLKAIALLQKTEALLEEVNAKVTQLDSPVIIPEWIDKHDATKIVCKHWKTLDRWRVAEGSSLIEGIHWQHDGGEIVYHAELLKDWYRNRSNPVAHYHANTTWSEACEHFTRNSYSNQPKKRGRKAG
ncbi:hypothetical protein LEP3755_35590 [Leptolyngbya sp. NIES-3755]|nr:hypothetical protein LEP3755_35590 [Leptolyngbya sp. NIES-3755]